MTKAQSAVTQDSDPSCLILSMILKKSFGFSKPQFLHLLKLVIPVLFISQILARGNSDGK